MRLCTITGEWPTGMRRAYCGVLTRQLPAASHRRTVAMPRQLPLGMCAARELQPQMRQATNTIIITFDMRAPCNTARTQLTREHTTRLRTVQLQLLVEVAVHCALSLFLALRIVAAHAGRSAYTVTDSLQCATSIGTKAVTRCCSVLCAAHATSCKSRCC